MNKSLLAIGAIVVFASSAQLCAADKAAPPHKKQPRFYVDMDVLRRDKQQRIILSIQTKFSTQLKVLEDLQKIRTAIQQGQIRDPEDSKKEWHKLLEKTKSKVTQVQQQAERENILIDLWNKDLEPFLNITLD